jgi:hypothetical protein
MRPVTDGELAYLTPEAKARVEIDRQLGAAGWAVQDARAVNLSASRGVASLSAAAKAVTGSLAESGWGAPSGDGGFVALTKLRERLRDKAATLEPARSSVPASDTPDIVALVLAAGLALPLALHARYRGHRVEASVGADGAITYGGETYRSLSTAGTEARMKLGYAGGRSRPATNGWLWWLYTDLDGAEHPVDHLRQPAS